MQILNTYEVERKLGLESSFRTLMQHFYLSFDPHHCQNKKRNWRLLMKLIFVNMIYSEQTYFILSYNFFIYNNTR